MDSQIFNNSGLFHVWIWCLLKAAHKKQWVSAKTGRGTTEVELEPGQFVFTRNTAAKELRMSPSTFQKRIEKIKNIENLIIKSNNHYSIGSIVNWHSYQGTIVEGDNKRDKQGTSKEQARNNQTPQSDTACGSTSAKNAKNDKKVKKRDTGTIVPASEAQPKRPPCPYQNIIDIYHDRCKSLPIVQVVSDTLKKRLKARWREDTKRQNLEFWEWYFQGIDESDFLTGKVRDWAASFDWLIGPRNMTKVLNGNYLNRDKKMRGLEDWINE